MKKYSQYILLTLALLLTAGLSGCENYFDLNENPNLISNPPLNSLLSTTTQKTALNSQSMANITSYFVQYLASPGSGGSTDTYQETDYTGTWDAIYYAMADLTDMKRLADEQNAAEYAGVANVLLAYHLNLIADSFGSGPFSAAFTGDPLIPPYDSEEEMYTTAMGLLDNAITELSRTDSNIRLSAADDLIHQGNIAKWIKTAYALKARMLNKISGQSAYNPQAVLAAVEKSYTSKADDAQMSTFLLRNPWAQVARNNAALVLNGWLSEQLVDHLNGTTYGVFDPRIEKITDKTINDVYKGTVNGQGNVGGNNTVKDESYISLNSPLTGDDSPLLIVTYAEMKMVEAEAAFRAGDRARAYAAYQEGIRAHMEKLQVAAAAIDGYLANPTVTPGAGALSLALIFKEKYVVTYLNPEAWNDARRFDYQYKDFTLPVNAALPTFIRRVAYPSAELAENGQNVPDVGALSDELWWDK
ncbi:SusD/RagB family nutrient-binding outer membrane lipoprotein [Arundinibacter roseus]|uniref:SusD/RagB family nutrient-binding outer membrane lipoprotein n=1 Tax=Arundinibacter roseus TaxID=2070510 RepID=A0A4R4KBQ2_9BACT|nr:SusD/RagB family nutrient-binding outer membrane lipoprotein [Arundinibacter roseus]TDB64126.1 SusD/RagB family nutrient-binding outer membrane lipoprotein [Arundinibacter roseus]